MPLGTSSDTASSSRSAAAGIGLAFRSFVSSSEILTAFLLSRLRGGQCAVLANAGARKLLTQALVGAVDSLPDRRFRRVQGFSDSSMRELFPCEEPQHLSIGMSQPSQCLDHLCVLGLAHDGYFRAGHPLKSEGRDRSKTCDD
jgi:hypothetical protein